MKQTLKVGLRSDTKQWIDTANDIQSAAKRFDLTLLIAGLSRVYIIDFLVLSCTHRGINSFSGRDPSALLGSPIRSSSSFLRLMNGSFQICILRFNFDKLFDYHCIIKWFDRGLTCDAKTKYLLPIGISSFFIF